MRSTITRTLAAAASVCAATTVLAGPGQQVIAPPAAAATASTSFTPPVSIQPSAVLKVGPFRGGTRHVLLRAGTAAPAAKRVIVSGFGAHTPNGLVGQVAGVRRLANGNLDVTTTHAPLNRVVAPGEHHVVRQVDTAAGTASGAAGRSAAGSGPKPFSITASCPGSTARNIHLDGTFDLDASLDVEIDTTLFGVRSISETFTYGDDLDLRLLLDGKLSCKASMPIASLKVPFMLGPVPMVASLDLNADGTLTADGQLVLHGKQHLDATTGFSWTPSGGMQPIGSTNSTAHIDDPSFRGTAGLEVGVSAGVGLSVAEVIKAHIDARGYVGVKANPDWTPWWSTYAGVQVRAGLWVVFVGDIANWTIYDHRWDLDRALGIPTPELDTAISGRPYAGQLAAVGGNAPYTFALASGSSLPAGLSLSSSGAITGTPADVAGCQDTPFQVLATDAQLRTARRDVVLTVCFYAPPVIDSSGFTVAAGDPLDVQLAAHGDHGPFTWSSNALPSGFSLTRDGHLTAAQVWTDESIPVTVTDGVGSTASRNLAVSVPIEPPDDPYCPVLKPWLCD